MKDNYLIYLFCGQKITWDKRNFYLYENVWGNRMNIIDNKIKEKYGFSAIQKVYEISVKENKVLEDQVLVHLMLLIFQITLFEFLTEKHKPDLIIGISCGEIPALYCSGIIDLDTAIELAYKRGYYLNQTLSFGGSMVYVESNDAVLKQSIGDLGNVELCGINSPNTCFYGGKEEEIDKLIPKFDKFNFYNKKFFLKGCFHSSHMEMIKDHILNLKFNSKEAVYPFVSVSNYLTTFKPNDKQFYNSSNLYYNIRNQVQTSYTFQNIFNSLVENESKYNSCSNNYNINKIIIYEMCPFSSNNDYINDILQSCNESVYSKFKMNSNLFCLPSKPIINVEFLFEELAQLLNK